MKGLFFKCFGISKKKKKTILQQQRKQVLDPNPIKELSWKDIKNWTDNFSTSRVIGCGGFSTVYLSNSHIDSDSDKCYAIKMIYGRTSFEQELKIMRDLHHHKNIVHLIGYSRSDEDDQLGVLVLDYISNGTLQDKLDCKLSVIPIPWSKRMAIAYQLAESLDHLHNKCGSLPIVHGDIKASNVLLDSNLSTHLCDFGTANKGFSSSIANNNNNNKRIIMMASPGYTDPNYLRTGISSKKNDVYAFGIILLQLLTGSQPFCSRTGQLLNSIQNIIISISESESEDDSSYDHELILVDPRLAGKFDRQEASAILRLSARCLCHQPTLRPCTSQILHTISSNCNTTPISALSLSSKHR